MRDKYLHTNCLAALANMSAQFRGLHPYVAQVTPTYISTSPYFSCSSSSYPQRIVSLFETLARKHSRLVEGLQGVTEEKEEDGFTEVGLRLFPVPFSYPGVGGRAGRRSPRGSPQDGAGDRELLSGPPGGWQRRVADYK